MKALIFGVAMLAATGCANIPNQQPQEEIIGTWEVVNGEIVTHYFPKKKTEQDYINDFVDTAYSALNIMAIFM